MFLTRQLISRYPKGSVLTSGENVWFSTNCNQVYVTVIFYRMLHVIQMTLVDLLYLYNVSSSMKSGIVSLFF